MSRSPLLDDRFLLLETLGAGGMGRVYRAFDRLDERVVALKVLYCRDRPGPSHPLSAEYGAWSRVRHPNVIRAHSLGRARRGPLPRDTPYLVLESFSGRPADRALRPGTVPPAELEHVARRVLLALAHVHGRGLVHRDLKPDNVLVGTGRRGPRRVKLTDFGLAVDRGSAGRPGRLSGSLPYVAPESVVGARVDGRTDLYGLGILLFYLATGVLPSPSRDPDALLRWHLDGPPADPGDRRPEIGARLSRLVRRMTERDPDARPRSADEALVLLGGRRPPRAAPRRPEKAGRARAAELRTALDRTRLGSRRRLELPSDARRRGAWIAEARVLAHVHGLSFHRLGVDPRLGRSNLSGIVLDLLLERGPSVRAVIARHRLHHGLPLGVLGGLPVWDRLRPDGEIDLDDPDAVRATARGVATFLTRASERRTLVLVVDPAALRDPLAREVVAALGRERSLRAAPGRGGMLVLLPPAPARRAPGRLAAIAARTAAAGAAPRRRARPALAHPR